MVSDDGAEIPFGRSLTYRFAHAAFFAAYAFAGAQNESIPWGAVRHTVLTNLHHWFQYPITNAAGVLTIGYQYPNLLMSERYNAPGSPYWAFKAFLFWRCPPIIRSGLRPMQQFRTRHSSGRTNRICSSATTVCISRSSRWGSTA